MTKLFIANCKAQDEEFFFRVPGSGQLIKQTIRAGGQEQIYKDSDRNTLELIVEQHRKYGLIAVADIDRTKPFIAMCYQFDKFITQNQIAYGVQHNTDVLTEVGKERRDQAAVAISSNLENVAQQAVGQTNLNSVKLEIQEDKPIGDNSPGLNEIIHVDKNPAVKGSSRKKK